MAHINSIWLYGSDKDKTMMAVNISLSPSGSDRIAVQLPQDFADCLHKIAQLAADLHEQKMRAQILTDTGGFNADDLIVKPPMRCG